MSTNIEQIKSLLLSLLPKDGSTVGNLSLKEQLRTQHQLEVTDEAFDAARQSLLAARGVGVEVQRILTRQVLLSSQLLLDLSCRLR